MAVRGREQVSGGLYPPAPSFSSRNSEEMHFLFEAVWGSALDAIALSDPDRIVLAANPAYCEFYKYLLEELVGQSFSLIFPEEQRAEAEQEYRRTFVDKVNPQGVPALAW